MPDRRNAVREAHHIFKTRDSMDIEARDRAIALLASHELWSRRQIISITGASPWFVSKGVDKTDNKGARLNPESLELMDVIIRNKDKGELDRTLFVRAVGLGTSPYLVATLTGYSPSSVKRYAGLIDGREAA